MLVLETLVNSIEKQIVLKKKSNKHFVWIRDTPTTDDLEHIRTSATLSPFDPLKIRSTMLQGYEKGEVSLHTHVLLEEQKPIAKVLVLCEKGVSPMIPWTLWKQIFQAFGSPSSSSSKGGNNININAKNASYRIVLFASQEPRHFPNPGEKVSEANVNGGYAYPHDPRSIVIYRREEATRVLIHELLHACGTDDFNKSEEEREALTETWAELFLIGILSKGSITKAKSLLHKQLQWIVDQAERLQDEFGVHSSSDYAYRYTVGRIPVLQSLGFKLPKPSGAFIESLRFTEPSLVY
jgi:hypothetical protein